jgi:hypothetical protein
MVLVKLRLATPLGTALVLLGTAVGCVGGPEEARQARVENDRMDWLDRQCRDAQTAAPAVIAARAQSPADIIPPPDVKPQALPALPIEKPALIAPTTASQPADRTSPAMQGESQVRIVATIGTTPIYEREVREAVYQRLHEFVSLSASERRAKEQSMFKEELRRIIERELVLEELFAMLNTKKQSATINQLKEQAAKDADNQLKEMQRRANLSTEADVKAFLRSQGLSQAGIRRHFERRFMMSAFMGERLKPKMNNISLADVKDYYAEHADEFMTTDRVKWQDLFIRVDRFNSPADCKKYVDWLLNRVRQGEDFAKLINEFDMGDSKSRGGMGFGEEQGKIFPPELETTIFALKQGQVSYVEFESGYHIIRVAERTFAGKKPFDEQVQTDIRRKLQAQISDREFRKIVESLWTRSQPQILID